MVIVTNYELIENPQTGFLNVRCAELIPCPCCGNDLKVVGSRRRKFKTACQEKILIIRRLRCLGCSRIHHELPDCLVPYKRYAAEDIEQVLTGAQPAELVADDSTLYRLKKWFNDRLVYLLGGLRSIAIRLGQDPVQEPSVLSQSVHQRIGHYVGNEPGWLARIVRAIVNANWNRPYSYAGKSQAAAFPRSYRS